MPDSLVNRSGTITAGGTAQTLAEFNGSRLSLTGQNISANDIWINETGSSAEVDATGSYKIAAGEFFAVVGPGKVSIIGGTTGQKFSATEVSK